LKKILLIVGKSGSGKDYLCKLFQLKITVSHTTRSPRKGEIDGIDKNFHKLSDLDLNWFNDDPKIVAKTKRGEDYYWVTEKDICMSDAFIVDVHGVETLYEYYKDDFYKIFRIIYFDVSEEQRIDNMRKRGDSEESIQERLEIDKTAFDGILEFKHEVLSFW